MAKTWKYVYAGNRIEVRSGTTTQLLINDVLQDQVNGVTLNAELTGHLEDGKKIKASVGGVLTLRCSLFVDDVLQQPVIMR